MDDAEQQPGLVLRSFTYAARPELLPELGRAIDHAGGWVLERRPTSAATLDLFVEVQVCALPEVYAALLAGGLELTRDSHRAMAERCNCGLYLRGRGLASILSLRVEIHFLTDPVPPLDLKRLLQMDRASA